MKILSILALLTFTFSYSYGQFDQVGDFNNYGDMTLGNSTGKLYQFAGLQDGDNTGQSAGGFGILSGASQISPIIWMYSYGGRNAFQVRKKSYNGTVQDGTTLFHVGVGGNIGIGTDDPQNKLSVQGKINLYDPSLNRNMLLSPSGGSIEMENASLYLNRNSDVFIATGGGKVGIGDFITGSGVTNDYKLYVTKGIRTEKVKVDIAAGSWADYVFEEDYKPATLKEVESYIKVNKHLPNIPSAEEVEKEGLNLGEMDVKLLQKVEELTLYLIEQNKIINELQYDVKNLKKDNELLKLTNNNLKQDIETIKHK